MNARARDMLRLEDQILFVPDLSKHDWQDAIDQADGAERELIMLQARMAVQLDRFRGAAAEPEILSWMILWSRNFNCLEAARAALSRECLFAIDVLQRVCSDLSLHILTIMENPSSKLDSQPADPDERTASVRARLQAYLAWCIHHDIEYRRVLIKPENLSRMYDPTPARDLIRSLGAAREYWEALMGTIDEVSDAEAEAERTAARTQLEAELKQFEVWLSDERLAPWSEMLRDAKGVSFFQMFRKKHRSVKTVLESMNQGFGYASYMRGSFAIHGSSLELFLGRTGDTFAPLVADLPLRVEKSVQDVISMIQWCTYMLQLMALSIGHPARGTGDST